MARTAHEGHIGPDEKDGPNQRGTITKLFEEEGYGFLLGADGQEVRFSADVVERDEFEELRVGSEVLYDQSDWDDGLDATTGDLLSIPYPGYEEGEEPMGDDDEVPEMPDIWDEEK